MLRLWFDRLVLGIAGRHPDLVPGLPPVVWQLFATMVFVGLMAIAGGFVAFVPMLLTMVGVEGPTAIGNFGVRMFREPFGWTLVPAALVALPFWWFALAHFKKEDRLNRFEWWSVHVSLSSSSPTFGMQMVSFFGIMYWAFLVLGDADQAWIYIVLASGLFFLYVNNKWGSR